MRTAESSEDSFSVDVEALQAVLAEHPVRLAILFGSQATASTHGTSDIDVAVDLADSFPSDPEYNEVFFGLSADLSSSLGTDDIDLVDLQSVSSALARAIFDQGILLVGDEDDAAALRRQLLDDDSEQQSPRERLDSALASIDEYLDERPGRP